MEKLNPLETSVKTELGIQQKVVMGTMLVIGLGSIFSIGASSFAGVASLKGNNGEKGKEIARTKTCGDGRVQGLELCDEGINNGQEGSCNTTCSGVSPSICGSAVCIDDEIASCNLDCIEDQLTLFSDNEINSLKPDTVISHNVYPNIGYHITYGEEVSRYVAIYDSSLFTGNIEQTKFIFDRTSRSWENDVAYGIYRILEPWNPNSVTWNNQPLFASSTESIGQDVGYSVFEFDITALANDWKNGATPNYGFLIKKVDESIVGRGAFTGKEYGSAGSQDRPWLAINEQVEDFCYDSDPDDDILVKGLCSDDKRNITKYDYCSSDKTRVAQFRCSFSNWCSPAAIFWATCPAGTQCEDGACK